MTDQPGLRERKKLQTRRAILDAAVRLFEEKGYDQTTVSEIAAAADVATKTFFNYFPAKDDLLFADQHKRVAIVGEVIDTSREDETLAELFERLCALLVEMVTDHTAGWRPELAAVRLRIIHDSPALQARALKLMFDLETDIADALRKVHGDKLDPISAAAVVGVLVGAVQAAGQESIRLGESVEQRKESARRALEIAMRGIGSVGEQTERG